MPGFDVWHQQADPDGFFEVWGEDVCPEWLPRELAAYNVVRVSQSFVESWRKCPSSAVAEKRATYAEAAAAGIVAHSIMDVRLVHQAKDPELDQHGIDMKMAELAAAGWFPENPEEFDEKARIYADVLTNVYFEKYHRYAPNILTEAHGSIIWDVRDDPRNDVDFIVMTGSADMICVNGVQRIGVDWKTGAKMPEPWMIQRYGVQWRAYAVMFELDEMHFEYPLAYQPLNGGKGDWVANRYKGVATVRANHLERADYRQQLLDEILPIAGELLRSQAPEDHVIRPTDWHCSAKWCQRFAAGECMGRFANVMWISKSHLDAARESHTIQLPTTTGDTQQ